MKYQPPYSITSEILNRIAAIGESLGRLSVLQLGQETCVYGVSIGFAPFMARYREEYAEQQEILN